MCITCEHMLYEEHRSAEMEGKVKRCRKCKKFPSNGGKQCYHCYSIGNIVDECPECRGKPWSEEFLAVQAEIESEHPQTIQ